MPLEIDDLDLLPASGSININSEDIIINEDVIINELLCFVSNKMHTIPMNMLIQICENFYGDDDVETAKSKLFSLKSCTYSESKIRYSKRQGDKKRKMNLEDIIKKLMELDNHNVAVSLKFVALDLTKLPPVSFDNMDVSVLLQRMESVADEVVALKFTMESQVKTNKDFTSMMSCVNTRITSLETNNIRNVEGEHNGQIFDSQVDFPKLPGGKTKYSGIASTKNEQVFEPAATFASLNTVQQVQPNNVWTEVVKKKKANTVTSPVNSTAIPVRKPPMIGKANGTGLSVAVNLPRKRTANVFATRFGPNQSGESLKKYIEDKLNVAIQCTQLESRHPDAYSSFYIRAECDNPEIFMDTDLWPEGIQYRWYRPPKA